MREKPDALEKLKDSLKAETRGTDETVPIKVSTENEVSALIDDTIIPAFEQIRHEIEPQFKKVRIVRHRYTVGFYVKEAGGNYYCGVQVIARMVSLWFHSNYAYSTDPKLPQIMNFKIYLMQKLIEFQNFGEISADTIIDLFNESFLFVTAKKNDSYGKTKHESAISTRTA